MRRLIGGWLLIAVTALPTFAVETSGSFFLFGTSLSNPAPVVTQPAYSSSSVNTTSLFFGFNSAGSPTTYTGNTIASTPQTTTTPTYSLVFAFNGQASPPVIAQPGLPSGGITIPPAGSGPTFGVGGTTTTSNGSFFFGTPYLGAPGGTGGTGGIGITPLDGPLDSPEPATIALMCGGFAALALLRRRMVR